MQVPQLKSFPNNHLQIQHIYEGIYTINISSMYLSDGV
jgi:hypothetical protein